MDSEAAQTTDTISDTPLSAVTDIVADLPAQPSQPTRPFPSRRRKTKPNSHVSAYQPGSQWTPERRRALAEKTRQWHAERKAAKVQEQTGQESASATSAAPVIGPVGTVLQALGAAPPPPANPFALTEDHDFQQSTADHVDIYRTTGNGQPHLIGSFKPGQTPLDTTPLETTPTTTIPTTPGTPASPYRHCPCLGVMPGRACPHCLGSRWVKLCPRCEGTGRLDRTQRAGASRSEVCGGCGGRGEAPASLAEVRAIQAAAAMAAVPELTEQEDGDGDEVFRRAVRLPGIGVTSRKRRERVRPRKKPGEKAKRQPQIQFGKWTEQ